MTLVRQISAVIVADSEGGALASKYFHPRLDKAKRTKFDSELKQKLVKLKESDGSTRDISIIVIDEFVLQVKQSSDVLLCVVFDSAENDLLIQCYTDSLWRCLSLITGNSITKRKVLEKLDSVFLMIDESCERGIILDDDADNIMSKIEMKISTPESTPPISSAVTMDSFRNALAQAKGQLGSFLGR